MTKTTCSFCKKAITLVDPQPGTHAFCGAECSKLHHLKWHVNQERARKRKKERQGVALALFLSVAVIAQPTDPNLVSYWLNRLERICVCEEELIEASEWSSELEPGAMDSWNDGLRRQIKNEMEAIERECR